MGRHDMQTSFALRALLSRPMPEARGVRSVHARAGGHGAAALTPPFPHRAARRETGEGAQRLRGMY
jgi:hypothetical protein